MKNKAGNGGAMRDRTADLLDANQALSQLSYGPVFFRLAFVRAALQPLQPIREFRARARRKPRKCTTVHDEVSNATIAKKWWV